jgi:hypothetical protein
MDVGLALTVVSVVEAELVAAVVTHRHGHLSEAYHLDVVGVTWICAVRMITSVHGGQRGPNDRVWTVRRHETSIGNNPTTP